MPVLGLVDVSGCRTKDRDLVFMEPQGKVVGDLSSHRNHHSVRRLKFKYIHYPLKGELVEIEPVTFVIIRRDSFRVVIDQHSPVTLFLDRLETCHRAPVEFYGRTDPVGT